MSWPAAVGPAGFSPEEERLRPLYARVLRLQYVDPGAMLCFCFLEGTMSLGLLLALAELVSWWGVLILPLSVAAMVKVNDLVAAAVARSAARVPAVEQERFRREMQPAVGRAVVPVAALSGLVRPPDSTGATEPMINRPAGIKCNGRRKKRSTGGWLTASWPIRRQWLDLVERYVRLSSRRGHD